MRRAWPPCYSPPRPAWPRSPRRRAAGTRTVAACPTWVAWVAWAAWTTTSSPASEGLDTSPSEARRARDLEAITADGLAFSAMVGLGETYVSAFALAAGL